MLKGSPSREPTGKTDVFGSGQNSRQMPDNPLRSTFAIQGHPLHVMLVEGVPGKRSGMAEDAGGTVWRVAAANG